MSQPSCKSPKDIDSSDSIQFLDSLGTHLWEMKYRQKISGLGLIIRFRCSRCQLEWSNIVVDDSEKEESKYLTLNEKEKKPVFDF